MRDAPVREEPMRLEATLTREDLKSLVDELMPVTILLGQKGKLSLSDPTGLELMPNHGLRVSCHAHGSWEVLGVGVPITLTSLAILLEPSFAMRPDGDVLVFKLQIVSADIAMVPGVIAHRIVDLVNGELAEKHVELAWRFRKTLSHEFSLPESLENLASIGLTATAGSLEITPAALVFNVAFETDVGRRPAHGATGQAANPDDSL
jgi:hypothetical protein